MPNTTTRSRISSDSTGTSSTTQQQLTGVAVIGCGHWGPNLIRTFDSFTDCAVQAVDLSDERRERIRGSFPDVPVASDYRSVYADPKVDAVVIATPTSSHEPLVREALLAGKHVLCEKPLCTNAADARRLVELASERSLLLMTGHIFLFNPGIRHIKSLVDKGELGDLLYLASVRTNLGPIRSDVNAAMDLASHDVSIFNWLLDAVPTAVSATGGDYLQPGIHDVVFVNLTYPNRQVASIHVSWLNPNKVRRITAVGARRMVTWDDMELTTPVAIYDRGANVVPESSDFGESLRISMWDGDVRLPKIAASEPLKLECRYFLDSIREGRLAHTDALFALGVVRVLEAVNESLSRGGAPVSLD